LVTPTLAVAFAGWCRFDGRVRFEHKIRKRLDYNYPLGNDRFKQQIETLWGELLATIGVVVQMTH